MTMRTGRPTSIAGVTNTFKDAVIDKCCEHNCKLGLGGISNCAILKGEKITTKQKMCDCIIIHDIAPPRIVLVELKSSGVKVEQIVEKFKNGVQFLLQTDFNVIGDQESNINMLLLVKRRVPRAFYTRVRAQKLKIKGKKHSITTLRCGVNLVDVYKELA